MYLNLSHEMRKQKMTKKDLTSAINNAGYPIAYGTLCKKLSGHDILPFQLAGIIAGIIGQDIGYLFSEFVAC